MYRAIIFDLDDTLYPMEQFVTGGYKAVGDYLAARYKEDGRAFAYMCLDIYRACGSMGHILSEALEKMGLADKVPLEPLIEIYREHVPNLELYEDAGAFLAEQQQHYLFGVITDGNPRIQKRKMAALKLGKYMSVQLYTGEWPGLAKPAPGAFSKTTAMLGVKPKEAVYVGDNPFKDFKGAKEAGLTTVRLLRGERRDAQSDESSRAHFEVNNFDDILNLLQGGTVNDQ